MVDYKDLKLKASSSPHIRAKEDTRSVMLDVILALLPALAFAVYNFGLRALMQTLVSAAGAAVFEALYRVAMKKHQTVGDLSAVVTGILIAFVCPVTAPYWMLLIGDFFAIVLVKQLYGGIGKNFVNPALAARAFLLSWASQMSTWAIPGSRAALFGSTADVATFATPMSYLHTNDLSGLEAIYDLKRMFVGTIGGSMGETSALCLLLGLAWLLGRKVISWHIPVSYVGTVAVLTFLFPRGNDAVTWMLYNLLGGGLLLGAIFMATDYATSPVTLNGQLLFGVGCGALTVLIRYFGGFPEGVSYAILIMNLCSWAIDKAFHRHQFGVSREDIAAAKQARKAAKEAAK